MNIERLKVSILGLVDKGLRLLFCFSFYINNLMVSILGLVDKGLRRLCIVGLQNDSFGFNPWFSG